MRSQCRSLSIEMTEEKTKKSSFTKSAMREARRLMIEYRGRLAIGMVLMIINRLAGMVLPASSKYLIDDVIGNDQTSLLLPLGVAVGIATAIQAATTFGLSQVISVAAQRAIMNVRQMVQRHVIRLPIRFFDQSKSGELISRIMTDAEGIRNLVGTGIDVRDGRR